MSLQLAAKHLADKGRGPDTTLVHMSNKEVKSLNDLAMAHGGHLTINPQTGLPEAGFLSAILPMVAGAALGPAGMGLTAMQAGLAVGAGSYLLNPKGGLMGALSSGLGGYGGAGLGAGLENLATSEAGQTAQNAATKAAADAEAQAVAERTAAIQDRAKGLTGDGLTFPGESTNTGTSYAGVQPGSDLSSGGQRWGVSGREPGFDSFRTTTMQPLTSAEIQNIRMSAIDASSNLAAPPPTGFEGIKQGISSVMSDPSKLKDVGGGSWTGLAKMGLAAAAPAVSQQTKFNMPAATSQKSIAPRYKFNAGMVSPTPAAGATGIENTYFRPQYTALSDEEAKSMYGYAGGGPVEAMSNANAIGANTGFPQSYLHNNAYATPYQTPISQNVLMGAGDVSVDPYTGEQRMAAGGVSYDPRTQQYSKGISEALRPENRDVNIYNDTGGPGAAEGPSSSGAPSSSTGQGVSNTAQSVGLGMMGLGQAPGLVSGLAGLIGQAIVDGQLGSMSDVAAAIAAANAGGHSVTSDASGNVSVGPGLSSNGMGVATDGSDSVGSAPSDGGAPGMGGDSPGEARGGLSPRFNYHMATGGISDAGYNLGGYSDGGRLLRGPGDGVSDSIPAVIGKKQPARLADGEFVVPARIVSELGNGSTEAGARKLYAMMDRIQAARKKTVGKNKVAHNSRSDKYLPA